MPANPPENMPRISPYLYYEDVASALEWLSRAFGFRERHRIGASDGKVMHAEMALADGDQTTQNIYVYVDDVDAHFRSAKAAGAKILEEPKDQFYGDRRYGAEDPEGHQWFFAQHVRDVAPPPR